MPCSYRTVKLSSSNSGLSRFLGSSIRTPEPLIGFKANPLDCPDGLSQQFRLLATVPGVPSGAVEIASVDFIFLKGQNHKKAGYRLRLHTASHYHDFSFRLDIGRTKAAAKADASKSAGKGDAKGTQTEGSSASDSAPA